jgi:HNH endonuclease
MIYLPVNVVEKLVIGEGGCWLWTGKTTPHGYAQVRVDYKLWMVHRFVMHQAGHDIEGAAVHHKCHNRLCANPDHLEVMKHALHMHKHHARRPTHCPQGHPYSEENTYIVRRRDGKTERVCHSCQLVRSREAYARRLEREGRVRTRFGHKLLPTAIIDSE